MRVPNPVNNRVIIHAITALLLIAPASAGAQTVIKLGSPTIKESVHEGMKTFKARLEERAGARVRVDLYPLSQLGTIPRMIEGVQLGTIEMAIVPPAFLVGIDKRFGVLAAPGVFDDLMHGYRTVQDPEFVKAFWSLGEAKGIKIIGMQCTGDTNYVTRTPIRTLSDFNGKKLRTFPSAMEREALRRLGASPAPMPLIEVLPGIQRGTIDGAKSGVVVFVAFKFQTTAKYVLTTRESLICPVQMASKSWFGKLPRDLQQSVLGVAKANDQANQTFAVKFNNNMFNVWKKVGGELTDLPAAEKAEFKRRMAGVGDEAVKGDAKQREMYELLKRVAARHKKG